MPSQTELLKRPRLTAAVVALLLALAPASAQAVSIAKNVAPPADLKQSIGFMSLVQLPCAYSPALAGADAGHMTIFNPTAKNIDRGRPVIYRLSATGEHFTVHLKADAAPGEATRFQHRHAEFSGCEAWTYVR